jgi:hypothetical protein
MLGSLIRGIDSVGLYPRPNEPFPGLSFASISEKLREMKSPTWSHYDSWKHGCTLAIVVGEIVSNAESKIQGLDIKDFKNVV